MRLRATWLVVGSVACGELVAACGLSVGGLSPDLGLEEAGLDATFNADGATLGADAHPGDDATSVRDGASGGHHDARASDAGTADDGGSPADDGGPADAGSDADYASACDGAAGCVVVPPGWTLIAFAPSQTPACPAGFQAPTDLVEGPNASAACTCGACSVTGLPSCTSGAVGVYYDTAAFGTNCASTSLTGPLHNAPAGGCGGSDGGDMYHGSYSTFDIKYVAPPATGGACATPGAATGNVTYSAHDRACTPISPQAAGCAGNVCVPNLAGTYNACIMQAGVVACPSGPLSVQHLVGSGASFGCSDCGCAVGATCTGTVTLYRDTRCMDAGLELPADGTCNNIASLASGSTSYNSYVYTGAAPSGVHCTPSGSSSPQSVALAGPETVCCAP